MKLDNCFLDKNVAVKVADFGLMKVFAGADAGPLTTKCGTTNYMGPELHSGQAYDGEKSDIFAMGVMLFMMLTSMEPFHEATPKDKWWLRLNADAAKTLEGRKINMPDSALDLIMGMLREDPTERLDINGILAHSWFQGDMATQNEIADFFMQIF